MFNSTRVRSLCVLAQNLQIVKAKLLADKHSLCVTSSFYQVRGKKDDISLSSLFKPVAVKPTPDDINVGAELTGSLNKADLLKVLNKFYQQREVKQQLKENGLDRK